MIATITVSDFNACIDDYLHLRLCMNHQPSSVNSAYKDLTLFSRYCRAKGITAIKGQTMIDFMKWLREERGNCSGTINRKQSSLKTYFTHLKLRQVEGADKVPFQYMTRARDPYRGPVKTLEFEEVIRLLQSIDKSNVLGLRDFTLFSLIYALGLRLGEAIAINVTDIDFINEILHIHGKGRRERDVPLTKPVSKLLKTWLEARCCMLNALTEQALFISKKGNRLAPRTAEDNFQKIVTRSGPFSIDHVTPHTLRHAFASHAVDGNCDMLVLKTILGHASIKTTELYIHPSIKTLRAAINKHVASDILEQLSTCRIGVFRMQKYRKGKYA
ncbi:tyrosine-type recombinase/integrase [Fibrobacterota bacterium]